MEADQALFDCIRAYKKSRILSFALKAGVLAGFGDRPRSLHDVASTLSLDATWLGPIVSVLVDLDLIERQGDLYAITSRGINAREDRTLIAFSGYHFHCYGAWQSLPQAVSLGEAQGFHGESLSDRDFRESYVLSMDAMSSARLPFLEQRCSSLLTGDVLDIGAGPATLTRHLAGLGKARVTALDLPEIVETARVLFGEPSSFRWEPADFFSYEPQASFDAAFCGHFLEYCPAGSLGDWLHDIRRILKDNAPLSMAE